MILEELSIPIVQAPLAGGPSTPALAAAVSDAGGLGFLGSGYLPAARLADDVGETRRLTGEPFGVNLFVPGRPSDPVVVARYAEALGADAAAARVELGRARFSDDE